jgi:hypothetical protein
LFSRLCYDFCVNGPAHQDADSLIDIQLEMVRNNMRRMSNQQLERCYAIYLRACAMQDGKAPKRSALQYFGEAWKEQRRCDSLRPDSWWTGMRGKLRMRRNPGETAS